MRLATAGVGRFYVINTELSFKEKIVLEIAPILCIAKFNFAGKNLSVGGLCILAGNNREINITVKINHFYLIKYA